MFTTRHKNLRPAAASVIPAKAGIFGTAGREQPAGFTLPELLIAIAIFSAVATVTSSLYIQSFHEIRRANLQGQIYEDARYIMARIADEVRNGMVDYDEYYNQNVVIPTLLAGENIQGASPLLHFGQNYGRYYSSFFHPGSDAALGFRCNDGGSRNRRECTPLRRTIDRNTGANPFIGKFAGAINENENAFCGNVSYATAQVSRPSNAGNCDPLSGEPLSSAAFAQNELYLISSDGFTKTILAREKIGAADDAYALSILRLKGVDTDSDGIADHFVCADGFECRGGDGFDVTPNTNAELNLTTDDGACGAGGGAFIAADLPRSRASELEAFNASNPEGDNCDTRSNGFSKDFVPLSPLSVNVAELSFGISPDENPNYAFSEGASTRQPYVTVSLTVTHPEISQPLTLAQRISSRVRTPVPAPILAQ